MGQLFGTDGVRGVAGHELTAGLAMRLATAAAEVLTGAGGSGGGSGGTGSAGTGSAGTVSGPAAGSRPAAAANGSAARSGSLAEPGGATTRAATAAGSVASGRNGDAGAASDAGANGASGGHGRPLAVVGRDPRVSGEFLEAAVVAGLAASGVDVVRLGVIPTPGVAHLTAELGAQFGVVLSASHNPAPDNGIKFFARGGVKLPDAVEDAIEARLLRSNDGGAAHLADAATVTQGGGDAAAGPVGIPGAGFGRVIDARDQRERYLAHLLSTVQVSSPLAGLRVVVDCANGAASEYAPELLRRAGADVIAIGAQPDGLNINEGCGSTHLSALSAAVVESGADAGIAHDGDADRCLAVDASGQVLDGDQILAVLALALHAQGRLAGDTVVATVMANLGFRHAMRAAGLAVVETPVGDRNLIAAMLDGGYVLGGEQSGHIIMLEHATTGDGMLTGLHLLAEAVRQGRPLADLASVMTRYPQVLINVPGVDKAKVTAMPALADAIASAKAELGDAGRVLVRPSGTEPAVRVMVEATDAAQAERLAGHLADTVKALG
jgi:phosphoglucosamine mutase